MKKIIYLKTFDPLTFSGPLGAALAVDGFLRAMENTESAGLYSNQVRFPKDFVDIKPDDMNAADAEELNNTFPEDPELMAFELEMTYGGYKPGEALGGFEDRVQPVGSCFVVLAGSRFAAWIMQNTRCPGFKSRSP